MSSFPSISLPLSQPIQHLLRTRVSLQYSDTEVLARVAARYAQLCDEHVPTDLTHEHWLMITDALGRTRSSARPDLEPSRTTIIEHLRLNASMAPSSAIAQELLDRMAACSYAEWIAVLDRVERPAEATPPTPASGNSG